MPRRGGAGLQELAARAQEGQRQPGRRKPADGGRAPPGTPAALRAGSAPGRRTGGGRSCATVNEDAPGVPAEATDKDVRPLRGGTKGTAEPALTTWETPRPAPWAGAALYHGPPAQHCRRRSGGSGPHRRRGGTCSRAGFQHFTLRSGSSTSGSPASSRVQRSPQHAAPSPGA